MSNQPPINDRLIALVILVVLGVSLVCAVAQGIAAIVAYITLRGS